MEYKMNIFCKIKLHKWQAKCTCTRCGTKRDRMHDWNGCICTRCHSKRNENHQWDGCLCVLCRTIRNEGHEWDGCTCTRCHWTRNESHDWVGCLCSRCHRERHEWKESGISTQTRRRKVTSGSYYDSVQAFEVWDETTITKLCKNCGESKRETTESESWEEEY